MSQHDYNIANADGASFRADINNVLGAIATLNAGATAPSTTFPNLTWYDTANSVLKIRNNANTVWIPWIQLLDDARWVLVPGSNNLDVVQIKNAAGEVVVILRLDGSGNGKLQLEDGSGNVQVQLSAGGGGGELILGNGATQAEVYPLLRGLLASQATTSGTDFDFTIRSDAARVTMSLDQIGLSGTDHYLFQLGTSGGLTTTGYTSHSNNLNGTDVTNNAVNSTAGFVWRGSNQATGLMTIQKHGTSGNIWIAKHVGTPDSNGYITTGGGRVSLASAITQLRLTRTGTNTFDNGSIAGLVE